MITIISGTNRRNSECLSFSKLFYELYKAKTQQPVKLLALEEIAHDWFNPDMYTKGMQSESLIRIQDEYIIPAHKFLFVISEYNGSFPGAVKLFIDACTVRKYQSNFKGKKAALVGVATGRSGNLLGMDHLTGVLNHVGATVLPNRLPISRIVDLTSDSGEIIDRDTLEVMEKHAEEFLAF